MCIRDSPRVVARHLPGAGRGRAGDDGVGDGVSGRDGSHSSVVSGARPGPGTFALAQAGTPSTRTTPEVFGGVRVQRPISTIAQAPHGRDRRFVQAVQDREPAAQPSAAASSARPKARAPLRQQWRCDTP
eukprot:14703598-Alexandrium_andersonii.AAC.1